MTYCVKCGSRGGSAARFCVTCGAALLEPSTPGTAVSASGLGYSSSPAALGHPAALSPDGDSPPATAASDYPPLVPPAREPATDGSAAARHARLIIPAPGFGSEPTAREPEFPELAPAAGYPDGGGPSPGRRPSGAPAVFVIAALVLAVAAAGGWYLTGQQSPLAAAGHRQLARGARAHPAGGAGSAAATGSAAAPSAGPAPSVTPHAPAPAGTVTVARDAARRPAAPRVTSFLRRYFAAIRAHDYQPYARLFAQPESRRAFASGYRSTRDSGATLTGLARWGAGQAADVRFRSHQRAADSPTGTVCTRWHIVLYLRRHGDGYLIQPPPAGYHAAAAPCP